MRVQYEQLLEDGDDDDEDPPLLVQAEKMDAVTSEEPPTLVYATTTVISAYVRASTAREVMAARSSASRSACSLFTWTSGTAPS